MYLGEFTAARTYVEKALDLYDPMHRPFYAELLANDMLSQLLCTLIMPLALLGHIDQAWSRREAALAEARRLSHPNTSAMVMAWAAWTGDWYIRSEPGSMLQSSDQILAVAAEHGLEFFRMAPLVPRGWCLAALGRADEGIPLLTAGSAFIHGCGFIALTPWCLTLLADARRMAGQPQLAIGHLAEALRVAEETQVRWFQAETLRLRGDVLLAMADPAAAEASYHEAIAVARQQVAKLWEVRATMSLGRLWRDQGMRAEARELLAPVYGWFTEGFGTPVLQEAKALLDELA
jgi:tetratricopeptide (TPR) repeat protein